jgi:hypothetical protein
MINSFIDLINESNSNRLGLVDEMGIKQPERLTGSHIGRARQQTLDRNRDLANQPARRSYNEVAGQLENALKTIRRLDITMERPNNTRNYYPRFPEPIVNLMTELKSIDESRFKADFGKWRDVYPTESDSICFRTDGVSEFQRSHFPNGGIPKALRGTGLGFKLYRTLLKFAGYISSNSSGTAEKDKAWGSMLSYKSNPDGTPSVDDAHAVIGPGNWMAIDKGYGTSENKSELVEEFILGSIGIENTKPDKFDMDDELIAILPDEFLTRLNSAYLNQLAEDDRISPERKAAIIASRTESQRREEERRAAAEQENRARIAQQEEAQRQRAEARIQKYGAEPEADWEIGDFIVVKQYLYDTGYTSLPIRRVVGRIGEEYVAVKVQDAIQIDAGDLTMENAPDTRKTTDKTRWVKVNIERIPNLDEVNLTRAEQLYVKSLMNPETQEQHAKEETRVGAERIESERTANQDRASDPETFGELPQSGQRLKAMVAARNNFQHVNLLKKFRSGAIDTNFIMLNGDQMQALRNPFGTPVYVAFTGGRVNLNTATSVEDPSDLIGPGSDNITVINLVTGHIIRPPFTGLGLTAYRLARVEEADKLAARAGDHFYIANHMNNYGILATCDYTTRNTARQPFIYLRTFGGNERSTPVRLDLLRKLEGFPITI